MWDTPQQAILPSEPVSYYVATVGNDTAGDGSFARPFATLGRALRETEHGKIRRVIVRGGVYSLTATVELKAAESGVTLRAATGEKPVLDGGPAHLANLVTLNGATDVTVQGFTFENTEPNRSSAAVTLMHTRSSGIAGNRFINNDRGVLLVASDRNVIAGNSFWRSVRAGINAGARSDRNVITNNVVEGTTFFGTGTGSAGIWITGGSYNTISHNEIRDTAGSGIALSNWDRWDPSNVNVGNTVSYNAVMNADSSPAVSDSGGIYIDNRSGADMRTAVDHNLVVLNRTPPTGVDVGIYLDDFTSGVTVTANIIRNGNFAFHVHGGRRNTIRNNIFDLGGRSAPNIGAGLVQSEPGGPVPEMIGNTISGNIIYSTAHTPWNAFVIYGGKAEISGNLYYNVNGQPLRAGSVALDARAHWGNPRFTDAAGGDFTLLPGSAAAAVGFRPISQRDVGLTGGSPQ
jgi:parallel beta-helix repeat protein